MRVRLVFLVFLFSFSTASPASPDSAPRETLAAINALRLDPQNVFSVSPADRIELHQGDIVLTFEQGKLAFFQPFEGRITGFVFSGIGHTLSLPRGPVEKQQLARFLGAPVLDQQFVSIYARFTDDTALDLLAQLKRSSLQPATDESFTSLWLPQLERLNLTHSLRILVEKYSAAPRHFFHAGIDGILTGPFDILLDQMRVENFLIGQPRAVNKVDYYDVWTSYSLPSFSLPSVPFHASRYHINTTIRPDNSLDGDASVDFRASIGGERILLIELARALKVENISLGSGETLPFFQNEGLTEQQLRSRGDDTLCVFLPRPPQRGDTFTLRFHYRGNVIENYGNSVLYVGSRESWYPHAGDSADFAQYDLTFRWPKHLRLAATGEKSEEREDGDFRVARWKSDLPVPEAGFNLGEYAVTSISSSNHTVEVYANKLLEQAILSRLAQRPTERELLPHIPVGGRNPPSEALGPPPPSPADALKSLAREVDSSIGYFERYGGPFPFRHLVVSQIPGTFGQGWPGLLYLSTFSYLPAEAQERFGLNSASQEAYTDIIPVHEVAHQWWGNVVGWSSYRDQWIDEGLSVYLSLLFADSQKMPGRTLNTWLVRYRKRLLTKAPDSDLAPADTGPLVMGTRLASSKSPDAYDVVIYSKGAWVIHMLRQMLRQPNSHEPDARFVTLLNTLATKYAQKALSTEQLQLEIEALMTPAMDLEGGRSMEWFFEQYVRGTGIPRYRVEFTTHRTEKGFQVRGKLSQFGVPRSFIAPVPLYASSSAGHSVFLGTVVTSGPETSFSFNAQAEPRKVLIDPHMTLLCVSE
ncbi:MAG: M1 family aminopeptidase [Candidatus Acidiferrum sp.]